MRKTACTGFALAGAAALLVLACGDGGDRGLVAGSFEEAKTLAAENGSLIVLDFSIDN